MSEFYDDGPLWKRILLNELVWVTILALLIFALAFYLATRDDTPAEGNSEESTSRSHYQGDRP
ncbi:MAG: hypothetical protein ACYTAF_16135 [Planctomycetota bacterium]|jgi:hypothetical protein